MHDIERLTLALVVAAADPAEWSRWNVSLKLAASPRTLPGALRATGASYRRPQSQGCVAVGCPGSKGERVSVVHDIFSSCRLLTLRARKPRTPAQKAHAPRHMCFLCLKVEYSAQKQKCLLCFLCLLCLIFSSWHIVQFSIEQFQPGIRHSSMPSLICRMTVPSMKFIECLFQNIGVRR